METAVYVDVLLVLNYVVTALLVACSGKLLGLQIKRRRIVAAALVGSVGSLTIFFPFLGFFPMLGVRMVLSAAIVAAAFPLTGPGRFLKCWFVFFAVSFFFAGVMLAIWMAFAPAGMLYYNGVVYFNVRPLALLACTAAAYLLLTLGNRISRGGRHPGIRCRVTLKLGEKRCSLQALVDTGNSLVEPFSGTPVVVCRLEAVRELLGEALAAALQRGDWEEAGRLAGGRIRLVPYRVVGGKGVLPALRGDRLYVPRGDALYQTERFYLAVTEGKLEEGCDALLNPDLIGEKLPAKGAGEAVV